SQVLAPHTDKHFWVKAEVSSGRERGGAFYCDLIETDSAERIVAKMACTIWRRELSLIRATFRRAGTDLRLVDGTVVGFCCALRFSSRYGLSLQVVDADPVIALGELEIRKRRILERFHKEGLFEPNKRLPVPLLPQRIGLITSTGSAAYNDFVKTLRASGFGFTVLAADTVMQGELSEAMVLRALRRLKNKGVELVVIVRGGGSKSDLYYLDNEAVGRAIAGFSIPVWTGIGHEIDRSVLDYVANREFKTPTAVAEELVVRHTEMKRHLYEAAGRLRQTWHYRLDLAARHLCEAQTGIRQGTRKLLDVTAGALMLRAGELRAKVRTRIAEEEKRVALARRSVIGAPTITLRERSRRLEEQSNEMARTVRRRLRNLRQVREDSRRRFAAGRFLRMTERERRELERRMVAARRSIEQRLHSEQKALRGKALAVRAADPARALGRGYALVYDEHGNLIRSVAELCEGVCICTKLVDGTISSTVDTTEENKHE
ncbi:MAG: exodeoxyribonuclease VII large subunit, partial [Chitinivibrionales bacterium]|nr:exodeoxyribonuclease VII large subunit [Chitinivibrionales bacterium]MBD3355972.1 exodeoxyribonuclease VII large subunit [Chitinivibrionales bacterium]